jgi:hypothetical protein
LLSLLTAAADSDPFKAVFDSIATQVDGWVNDAVAEVNTLKSIGLKQNVQVRASVAASICSGVFR